MKDGLRSRLRSSVNFFRRLSEDLGTVCLGAAAIFLVRAFPSSCGECSDLDWRLVIASTIFLVMGLVLRYIPKSESD